LKQYLELGMELIKVNRVIQFTQRPWMQEYIDFNTKKRAKATNDFEKDLYKLMNNSVFGKTMENVRKRINYELVNDIKRYRKLVNDPTFERGEIINGSTEDEQYMGLVGVSRKRRSILLDKPIIIGFSILDLSKTLMYDYHYNTIKTQYGSKAKLLFTDTDSLCYEIETDDIYKDMMTQKDMYDFSDYPQDHSLYDVKNKKVIGKFKDEAQGNIINEFIGLRSKMYCWNIHEDYHKKAKGIKKETVKTEITMDNYRAAVLGTKKEEIQQHSSFNSLRSFNHDIYSISINKIGLCAYDDKRYILDDRINTLAHGHHLIKQPA
jgi:hypothetical protein